jgi:hypothetical protein
MCSVPLDSNAENAIVFVFNYKTGAWTIFDHASGYAPACIENIFDSSDQELLYATFYDNRVYRYNYGNDDAGTNIDASLITKAYSFDQKGFAKGMRRVHILCDSVNYSGEFTVYDDQDTAIVNRTVSLAYAESWKRYNLSHRGRLANTLRVGFEYSGKSPLEIEAFLFEMIPLLRLNKAH